MVETESLQCMKALKILMYTRDEVEGKCGRIKAKEREIEKEIEILFELILNHKNQDPGF